MSRSLGDLRIDLTATTDKLQRGTERANRIVQRFARKTSAQMRSAGKALSKAFTVPLVAIAVSSGVAADHLERMDRKIQVATGATGAALRDLQTDMRAVSAELPASFGDIASAVGSLNTSVGATGEPLRELVKTGLAVNRLLGEEAPGNIQRFGRVMRAQGVHVSQQADLQAKMFQAVQQNDTSLNELISSLEKYGPVLTNAGIATDKQIDLFARLEGSGLQARRVMPGINAAFRILATNGVQDLEGALAIMIGRVRDAKTQTDALALATKYFGAEGAARLTLAVRSGAFEIDKLGESLTTTAEDVQEMERGSRTLGDMLAQLKNDITRAAEPLGKRLTESAKKLIPVLEVGVDVLARMAQAFATLPEGAQLAIIGVGAFAASLGPVLVTTAALIPVGAKVGAMMLALNVKAGALAVTMGTKLAPALAIGLVALTALAGFELGRGLYDEFTGIQRAAAHTIAAVQIGWEDMKLAARITAAFVGNVFDIAFDKIVKSAARPVNILSTFVKGVEAATGRNLGGAQIGALSAMVTGVGTALTAQDEFEEALRKAVNENADAIKQIEDIRDATLRDIDVEDKRRLKEGDRDGALMGGLRYLKEDVKLVTDQVVGVLAPLQAAFGAVLKGAGITGLDRGGALGDGLDAAREAAKNLDESAENLKKTAKATGEEVDAAFEKSAKAAEDWKDRLIDATEGWSSEATDAWLDWALEGKRAFDQVLKDFGRLLLKMAIQESIVYPMFQGIRSRFAPAQSANGNIIEHAGGGITQSYGTFPMAGGAMGSYHERGRPEGILPLERIGGKLGVNATGSGGPMVQIINQAPGVDLETRETTGTDGKRILQVIIRDEVKTMFRRGDMDKDMASIYGAKRQGVGR